MREGGGERDVSEGVSEAMRRRIDGSMGGCVGERSGLSGLSG